MRTARSCVLCVAAIVLLSACSGGEMGETEDVEEYDLGTPGDDPTVDETDPEGAETPGTDPDAFEGEDLTDADMTVRSSPLGTHLVDADGRTLYVFDLDPPNERACTDECLSRWPVFSSDADPSGDDALDPELVDTIAGVDGTGHQVTYNGQPLYYYVDDQEVGDVEGQGRNDQWFVIDAQGEPIRGDG